VKGKKPKLLVILGPTASGKSALGIDTAHELNAQILSADSLQVYRHFDIGTAKPTSLDQEQVRHHMIDIIDPAEEFNAGMFRERASTVIQDLHGQGVNIIVAGGTYLYVKILLSGLIDGISSDTDIRADIKKENSALGTEHLYERLKSIDPEAASKIHANDYVRIERALEVYYLTGQKISNLHMRHGFSESSYNYMKIGITIEREALKDKIDERVDDMLERGFVEEVRGIRDMGYASDIKPMQSIGYKQINQYLDNEISLEQTIELIKRDTKRFAKRQMTWLRNDKEIKWFDIPQDRTEIVKLASKFFSS
jgi:tRNA dimethylallyltransferase